jgi:hypothetical protein
VAVLAALQSAALRLTGQKPAAFFNANNQLERELCDLINEVAQDVAKYQDWQALVRIGTIAGDGTTAAFALPADYDRMLVNTDVADLSSWFWGYGSYTDINAFLYDEARGFNAWPGGWIIFGDRLRFSPAPSETQTATFPYVSKYWARSAALVDKDGFTADDDTFLLPERLLTLGLVWRWRADKGLDGTGDEEAFIKALDEYGAKDKGSRFVRRRASARIPGTYAAWPWELGPATYSI